MAKRATTKAERTRSFTTDPTQLLDAFDAELVVVWPFGTEEDFFIIFVWFLSEGQTKNFGDMMKRN